MRWAALIQRIYEIDPLECPKCGGNMKFDASLPPLWAARLTFGSAVSFIEKHQADIIEKILKHCGLWQERRNRGPPSIVLDDDPYCELEYVNCEQPSRRRDGLTRSGGNEAWRSGNS